MSKPIIIIHGWSDSSKGMNPLVKMLNKHIKREITHLYLANYITMNDLVTMDDIVTACDKAWNEAGLSRKRRAYDVIVHSTGGLVIRHWLTKYFKATDVPIHHLVMLAPANFGSPLAQKGRALIGRIFKGIHSKFLFQTGTHVLKALELASPYSTNLALVDRFGSQNYYDVGAILCTVLVGNTGYSGLSAAANEPGTDGVVRASTANLNCSKLIVDYRGSPQAKIKWQSSKGRTAFKVIEGDNHSTIVCKDGGPNNPNLINDIVAALTVKDADFARYCRTCVIETNEVMKKCENEHYKHGFQNTVVGVSDQFLDSVDDFFLEFCIKGENCQFGELIHGRAIQSVHNYCDDYSRRSIFIDSTEIENWFEGSFQEFFLKVNALPDIRDHVVGYDTQCADKYFPVVINKKDYAKFIQPNRTLLVEIYLNREQKREVFTFAKK